MSTDTQPTPLQLARWEGYTVRPVGEIRQTVASLSEVRAKDALCRCIDLINKLDTLTVDSAEKIAAWRNK